MRARQRNRFLKIQRSLQNLEGEAADDGATRGAQTLAARLVTVVIGHVGGAAHAGSRPHAARWRCRPRLHLMEKNLKESKTALAHNLTVIVDEILAGEAEDRVHMAET